MCVRACLLGAACLVPGACAAAAAVWAFVLALVRACLAPAARLTGNRVVPVLFLRCRDAPRPALLLELLLTTGQAHALHQLLAFSLFPLAGPGGVLRQQGSRTRPCSPPLSSPPPWPVLNNLPVAAAAPASQLVLTIAADRRRRCFPPCYPAVGMPVPASVKALRPLCKLRQC